MINSVEENCNLSFEGSKTADLQVIKCLQSASDFLHVKKNTNKKTKPNYSSTGKPKHLWPLVYASSFLIHRLGISHISEPTFNTHCVCDVFSTIPNGTEMYELRAKFCWWSGKHFANIQEREPSSRCKFEFMTSPDRQVRTKPGANIKWFVAGSMAQVENLFCAALLVQLILANWRVNSGKCYSSFKQLWEDNIARALNIKGTVSSVGVLWYISSFYLWYKCVQQLFSHKV